MRYILMAGILLLGAGCANVDGPFKADTKRVDDPRLTIGEQQRWGRSNLALPEESTWIAPPGQTRPGAWGVQMH
jgi:hypothetical protein